MIPFHSGANPMDPSYKNLSGSGKHLSVYLITLNITPGFGSMEEVWTPVLVNYTTYTLPQLHNTIQMLATILAAAPTAKFSAVFKKYSSRTLMQISR